MNGFIVLIIGIVLVSGGFLFIQSKSPRKSYLFRQKTRKILTGSLPPSRLLIGYDRPEMISELKTVLREYQRQNPSVRIHLIHDTPARMIKKLEQGHLDLVCSLAYSIEDIETRPASIQEAVMDCDTFRFYREVNIANPAFSEVLYLLWHNLKASEEVRDLINYLNYDTVTLHTGYCNYQNIKA